MRILEDWDEVKLMYEALDSRKIQLKRRSLETITEKIAGLKLKFAMYTLNRMELKWRNAKKKNKVY
jgi:hypothetical protein